MQRIWWGNFELAPKKHWERKIGPLWFAIKRLEQEWQVFYTEDVSWDDENWKTSAESPFHPAMEADFLQNRLIAADPSRKFRVLPMLADRPVVTRPVKPIFIPKNGVASLFVSTPLWIKGTLLDDTVLSDLPIVRPSDTWFGSDTIQGEICYASRTSARLRLEELPKRHHRAITHITIRNESDTMLHFEKINLPVPFLSIYEDKEKNLWTQSVQMIRKSDKKTAVLERLEGPPHHAKNAAPISEAREKSVENLIIRTIGSFLA